VHEGKPEILRAAHGTCLAPILLVEDSDDDALLLQIAFQKTGRKIGLVRVNTSNMALRYLRGVAPYSDRSQFPFPRFMLLDLVLPGTDGFELLQEIRRSDQLKTLPVIALSACHSPAEIRRVFDLGVNSFMSKPAGTEDLAASAKQIAELWLSGNTSLSSLQSSLPLPGQVVHSAFLNKKGRSHHP
jgi:DNA-binding response OmpR family regulator